MFQVLELMKEVKEEEEEEEEEEVEEENSDISGYHSDSDSTVMMSGNSPFISKTARYNFLSRSGTLGISNNQYEISIINIMKISTHFGGMQEAAVQQNQQTRG